MSPESERGFEHYTTIRKPTFHHTISCLTFSFILSSFNADTGTDLSDLAVSLSKFAPKKLKATKPKSCKDCNMHKCTFDLTDHNKE